jgi:hypothetical protein
VNAAYLGVFNHAVAGIAGGNRQRGRGGMQLYAINRDALRRTSSPQWDQAQGRLPPLLEAQQAVHRPIYKAGHNLGWQADLTLGRGQQIGEYGPAVPETVPVAPGAIFPRATPEYRGKHEDTRRRGNLWVAGGGGQESATVVAIPESPESKVQG